MAVVDLCLGKLRLEAGAPAKAMPALDAYVARRPDDSEGHAYRARALVALGRPVEGAASFTRALEAMPQDRPRPEYYLERARALESAGTEHLNAALRGLDEGLARLGQPVVLQNYAIELELERGAYDGALARLERLADGSARKETWLVRRGEILESAGRLEEARAAYRSSLVAIRELPPSRRRNRAVTRLEAEAQGALSRLDEGSLGGGVDER
jgi:tetratricopeptide (TPR) repeat protein